MKNEDDENQVVVNRDFTRSEFLKGVSFTVAGLTGLGTLGACSPIKTDVDTPRSTSAEDANADSDTAEIGLADSFDASNARYDVDVVVGSGAAGMSAAVEAANQGGSVLLIERGATFGGSTAFAEGICAFKSKYQTELLRVPPPNSLIRARGAEGRGFNWHFLSPLSR
jgi:NADPH-dependent 2,4-dienoyl-CoA reductase/sulfur reductase-like enzyme